MATTSRRSTYARKALRINQGVTRVPEHLLPMSPVHTYVRRGSGEAGGEAGLVDGSGLTRPVPITDLALSRLIRPEPALDRPMAGSGGHLLLTEKEEWCLSPPPIPKPPTATTPYPATPPLIPTPPPAPIIPPRSAPTGAQEKADGWRRVGLDHTALNWLERAGLHRVVDGPAGQNTPTTKADFPTDRPQCPKADAAWRRSASL